MSSAVVLINPKTPYNVGSAIRACSIYGVPVLRWTGTRISTAEGRRKAGSGLKQRPRLPREERMKDYTNVDWREDSDVTVTTLSEEFGLTPVCVEIAPGAQQLHVFDHPLRPLYVFGPEDGGVPAGVRDVCHRFVRIPTLTRTPLNLAAAVNVVLYDRFAKHLSQDPENFVLPQERISRTKAGV